MITRKPPEYYVKKSTNNTDLNGSSFRIQTTEQQLRNLRKQAWKLSGQRMTINNRFDNTTETYLLTRPLVVKSQTQVNTSKNENLKTYANTNDSKRTNQTTKSKRSNLSTQAQNNAGESGFVNMSAVFSVVRVYAICIVPFFTSSLMK